MAERIRTESDSEKTEGKMVHADEYLEYTLFSKLMLLPST